MCGAVSNLTSTCNCDEQTTFGYTGLPSQTTIMMMSTSPCPGGTPRARPCRGSRAEIIEPPSLALLASGSSENKAYDQFKLSCLKVKIKLSILYLILAKHQ